MLHRTQPQPHAPWCPTCQSRISPAAATPGWAMLLIHWNEAVSIQGMTTQRPRGSELHEDRSQHTFHLIPSPTQSKTPSLPRRPHATPSFPDTKKCIRQFQPQIRNTCAKPSFIRPTLVAPPRPSPLSVRRSSHRRARCFCLRRRQHALLSTTPR